MESLENLNRSDDGDATAEDQHLSLKARMDKHLYDLRKEQEKYSVELLAVKEKLESGNFKEISPKDPFYGIEQEKERKILRKRIREIKENVKAVVTMIEEAEKRRTMYVGRHGLDKDMGQSLSMH